MTLVVLMSRSIITLFALIQNTGSRSILSVLQIVMSSFTSSKFQLYFNILYFGSKTFSVDMYTLSLRTPVYWSCKSRTATAASILRSGLLVRYLMELASWQSVAGGCGWVCVMCQVFVELLELTAGVLAGLVGGGGAELCSAAGT